MSIIYMHQALESPPKGDMKRNAVQGDNMLLSCLYEYPMAYCKMLGIGPSAILKKKMYGKSW